MIVVTSGIRFIDIDGYACIVGYRELLALLGKEAIGTSSVLVNESVTGSLRALQVPFTPLYTPKSDDVFVVVDVSDPDHFDAIVNPDKVVEIFDHHAGFEEYWIKRLGSNCHIEFIGAGATLIYEMWVKADRFDRMSKASATLLAAAILDNTLNFAADLSTPSDEAAYAALASHAELGADWASTYFSECQAAITADISLSLANDIKYLKLGAHNAEVCFGQMVVWDAKPILSMQQGVILDTMNQKQKEWLVNVTSISESCSYFLTDDPSIQAWLEETLGLTFDGSIAKSSRLWLRKEVVKASIEAAKSVKT